MKIGDTVKYSYSEFDGFGVVIGKITEVHEDHIIMTEDGINYWFNNEDIGNMENDSMDVQIIAKEYVEALEQWKKETEEKLANPNISQEERNGYTREILACDNEATTFKEYLSRRNKFRTLGVAPSQCPGHVNTGRKRR